MFLSVDVARDALGAAQLLLDGLGDGEHCGQSGDFGFADDLIVGKVAVVVGDGPAKIDVADLLSVAEIGMVGEGSESGMEAVKGTIFVESVRREGVAHGEGGCDLRESRVEEELQVLVLHLYADVVAGLGTDAADGDVAAHHLHTGVFPWDIDAFATGFVDVAPDEQVEVEIAFAE